MEKTISSFFKNVVLMSGTPDYKQINLTNANPENECHCSPKTAIENDWICKPTLNLIDCDTKNWPSAVKVVFEREVDLYKKEKMFKPTILVNCSSIDCIDNLRNIDWFKDNTGKKFHFISIHSSKRIKDKDSYASRDVTAEIDGTSVTSDVAYEAIEKLDKNELFNDDLPVLVAQVQMIGEGINVSSFNAVITASSADKTAMQQIGRAIRNYRTIKKIEVEVEEEFEVERQKSGFLNKLFKRTEKTIEKRLAKKTVEKEISKVCDGHANVYVLNDNLDSAVQLVYNLDQYDLTDNCFSWGQKIDILDGSAESENAGKGFCDAIKCKWNDISEQDPEITEIIGNAKKIMLERANKVWLSGEDNDRNGIPDYVEIANLVKSESKKNFKEVYVGKGKKTDLEISSTLMDKLVHFLETDENNRKLWKKSRLATLALVFQDSEIATFFLNHISRKQIQDLNRI